MPSPKDKFTHEFFEFDFFQAVRLLEKLTPQRVPVGHDGPPEEEIARFRPQLSMAFPPSQIVELDLPNKDRPYPVLSVTFFGLYGPSGVLPLHYTQRLLDLYRDERGAERRALRDWLDLFNHRLISLFYRAWEKYRFYLPYDRGEAFRSPTDPFTLSIRSLMGLGTAGLQDRLQVRRVNPDALPEHHLFFPGDDGHPASDSAHDRLAHIDDLALLYFAGFFAQRPRNASNLQTLLEKYFRLPVQIQQFCGRWLDIPEEAQTRLGEFGILGINSIAGSRTWDVQSRFRIRLGPLNFTQFEELLPDREPVTVRKSFFLVAQLARLFVGVELEFDIQLVLAAAEVPAARLGEPSGAVPRLGWTAWLITGPPAHDADDAVFDAEWVTHL